MPEAHSHIRSHPSTNYPVWLCSYRPLWIIAIIDLLVLGIIVFALTVSRQRDFEKIAATLENVSNSMDQILSWRFEKIHFALLSAIDAVESQTRSGNAAWDSFDSLGLSLDERLPETLGYVITNNTGNVIYASPRALTGEISVANGEHFLHMRDNLMTGLVISRPFYGHSWPHPIVVLSMPYAQPDGSFGGIVACAVSINMFSSVLQSVEIVGPSAMATLWDKKLGLITLHPEGQFVLDVKPSGPLRKLMMQDAAPTIYYHNRLDFNNKNRIAFFRKLSQWPLYLSIGLYEQDILGKWRQDLFSIGILGLMCLVISLWSGLAYTRHVNAIEKSEKRYKGLFDNMQAGLALFEPVFFAFGRNQRLQVC